MTLARAAARRGMTLVELLMAALIISIGIMGLVNVWATAFLVTRNTNDYGIAYTLGRKSMETVRRSGFANAAEGSATAYYDGTPALLGSSTGALYCVTTSVVSDQVQSGTSGVAGAVPADTAIRTVTITVTQLQSNTTVYTSTTYMARAGI